MSLEKVDSALALVSDEEELYLCDPQSDEIIDQAQKILNVVLSKDYRYFVQQCGSLSFGSVEIYGIINQGLDAQFHSNFIRCTLQNRKYGGPDNVYVIGHDELGSPSMRTGEEAVFAYYEGAPEAAQTYEVLAPSFGDYLFDMLAQQIEWRREE